MPKSRAYRATSVKNVRLERVLSGREDQVPVVGCDVSKKEIVMVLRWGEKDFDRPWKAKNPGELGLLVEMLKGLRRESGLTVALEPTGTYGDPLRQALADAGIVPHRVSPKASSDYAEIFDGVPSQHDGKDAAIVAELSALGKSKPWVLRTQEASDCQLAYWVDRLDAQRRCLNIWYGRLEGLLARHWPEANSTLPLNSAVLLRCLAHYGGPAALARDVEAISRVYRWGRGKLSRLKVAQLVCEASQSMGVRQHATNVLQMQQYAELALSCRDEITKAKKELAKVGQDNEVIRSQARVVGVVTACVLWVHLGDPRNYDCGSAYRKAMGLNLAERSSGMWQGRLKISKRGHGQVRRWLYFAALRWIREEPIMSWYENKKAKQHGDDDDQVMRAIIGVMRKVALALYQVGAFGVEFKPERLFDERQLAKKRPKVGSIAS